MKQLQPMTNSAMGGDESQKNPTSPNTSSTSEKTWQQSWEEAAKLEAPAKRKFMEEALRLYQQMHPEDTGL